MVRMWWNLRWANWFYLGGGFAEFSEALRFYLRARSGSYGDRFTKLYIKAGVYDRVSTFTSL